LPNILILKLAKPYGGVSDDQITSMVLAGEGFVLSGSTNTFGAGEWTAWLLKVSGDTPDVATESASFDPSPLVPLSIGSVALAVLSIDYFHKKRAH
jgi:hypothetical protein